MQCFAHQLAATFVALAIALCTSSANAAPADVAAGTWKPYRTPPSAAAPLATPTGVSQVQEVPSQPEGVRVAQAPSFMVADPGVEICQPPMTTVPMQDMPMGCVPIDPLCMVPSVVGVNPNDPALWQWRVLPTGVIWQSYWAGLHEPRMSGTWFGNNGDALLDVTLGGRASLVRYGTDGPGRPQGFELQVEGAAIPRLNLDHNWDLDATDFRFGLPLVYGREKWQAKFSYYHLSSHMGDEYAIRNIADDPLSQRINYARETLVLAGAFFPHPAWRFYSEAGWAFDAKGGSKPWEFQFGIDVAEPGPTGCFGTPFMAFNGHIREELNYGGNFVAQLGWLWRGNSTNTLRTGFHYMNGKSNQYEFFNQFEEQIGGGVWYDF